jgi:hypothetical protein
MASQSAPALGINKSDYYLWLIMLKGDEKTLDWTLLSSCHGMSVHVLPFPAVVRDVMSCLTPEWFLPNGMIERHGARAWISYEQRHVSDTKRKKSHSEFMAIIFSEYLPPDAAMSSADSKKSVS